MGMRGVCPRCEQWLVVPGRPAPAAGTVLAQPPLAETVAYIAMPEPAAVGTVVGAAPLGTTFPNAPPPVPRDDEPVAEATDQPALELDAETVARAEKESSGAGGDEPVAELDPQEDKAGILEPSGKTKSIGIASIVPVALLVVAFLFLKSSLGTRVLIDPVAEQLKSFGVPALLAPLGALLVVMLVLLIVLGIPAGIVICRWIKDSLVDKMPTRLEFVPATPEETAGLDHGALENYTITLQELGFQHEMDYTTNTDKPTTNVGFARLFSHPVHACYAEVNQVISPDGDGAPMRCSLTSILDQGWSMTCGTRDPASVKTVWLWRRPRSLFSCYPGADAADLLDAHLELRRKLIDALDLPPPAPCSTDAYFEHEQAAAIDRKQALERRSAVGCLLEQWLLSKKPRAQWLGDYPRLARQGKS
jgi:hypothetical protein